MSAFATIASVFRLEADVSGGHPGGPLVTHLRHYRPDYFRGQNPGNRQRCDHDVRVGSGARGHVTQTFGSTSKEMLMRRSADSNGTVWW
jgi:hypothetical protein